MSVEIRMENYITNIRGCGLPTRNYPGIVSEPEDIIPEKFAGVSPDWIWSDEHQNWFPRNPIDLEDNIILHANQTQIKESQILGEIYFQEPILTGRR